MYRKLQGHWIIEMSEMMATANAKSIEEIKAGLETTEKGGVRQSIRNCLTVFQDVYKRQVPKRSCKRSRKRFWKKSQS